MWVENLTKDVNLIYIFCLKRLQSINGKNILDVNFKILYNF